MNRKLIVIIACYLAVLLVFFYNTEIVLFLANKLTMPKLNEHVLLISFFLIWFSLYPMVLVGHFTRRYWLSLLVFLFFGFLFKWE